MRQHWKHLCVQRHNDSYKAMELWIFFTYSFRHDYEVMKLRILLGNHYKYTGFSQTFEAKKGLNPDVTCLHGLCWLEWVSFWERLLMVVPDLSTTSADVVSRIISNSPSQEFTHPNDQNPTELWSVGLLWQLSLQTKLLLLFVYSWMQTRLRGQYNGSWSIGLVSVKTADNWEQSFFVLAHSAYKNHLNSRQPNTKRSKWWKYQFVCENSFFLNQIYSLLSYTHFPFLFLKKVNSNFHSIPLTRKVYVIFLRSLCFRSPWLLGRLSFHCRFKHLML